VKGTPGTASKPVQRPLQTPENPPVSAVVEALCASFADYPKTGIVFKELTPVFADGAALRQMVDSVVSAYAGKLPRPVSAEAYALEYGRATLELHRDDITSGTRVLILDDVLATGGTPGAAAVLLERAGAVVAGVGVVLEIDELPGRNNRPGREVVSLPHA
jgi:adenine phosphoribosyltransferase